MQAGSGRKTIGLACLGLHFQRKLVNVVRSEPILLRKLQTCRYISGRGHCREGEISSREKDRIPLSSIVKEEAVEFDKLTADEKQSYRLHKEACQAGQSSYIDPATGYIVLTQYEHISRGKCCGSCCRHCPYGHANVPEKYRTKKFNSAFFV